MEGVPVARIAGIEIRVSLAWVLLLAFVTIIASEQASRIAPTLPDAAGWVIGGGVALGFLLSVLAHELVHTLVARRRGVPTDRVVLGFLGGMAPFDVEGRTASDELAIGIAGPLLSLVLGLVLVPLGLALDRGTGTQAALAAGILIIGALNVVLGVLSLLPGLPLDGGRIVRALAWRWSGDPRRGARLAATIGRATGWVLIGAGATMALAVDPTQGLMVLSLGWFVSSGARAVDRRLTIETLLDGATVADALEADAPAVAPHLTLDTFVDRFAGPGREGGATTLPVVADDAVLGVVAFERVRRLGRKAWATTRAQDVMGSPPEVPFLSSATPLWEALERLRRSGRDGLAVVDEGRLAGVLTRRTAMGAIRDRAQLQRGVQP